MKYSESVLVLVAGRADFPEGFGLRVHSDEALNVDDFLRENPQEVESWLDRFELLVFDRTQQMRGMDAIDDRFFPMHVDDPEHHPAPNRKNEPYLTCLRLLNPRRKDETHFAALKDYAGALRSWDSSFTRKNTDLSDLDLVHEFSFRHGRFVLAEENELTNRNIDGSRARARWAYERSPLHYGHPWGQAPDSAVLYKAGKQVEPKLVHGRLGDFLDPTLAVRAMGGLSKSGIGGKRYALPPKSC